MWLIFIWSILTNHIIPFSRPLKMYFLCSNIYCLLQKMRLSKANGNIFIQDNILHDRRFLRLITREIENVRTNERTLQFSFVM